MNTRKFVLITECQCSSGVEHFHGKEGVGGSNPFIGSRLIVTDSRGAVRGNHILFSELYLFKS